MTALRLTPVNRARNLIDEAIAANGATRVLWVAVLGILRARPRRRARPPDVERLPERLRQDIGLPQRFEPPRHYDIRFR